jgi:hypothetical protein
MPHFHAQLLPQQEGKRVREQEMLACHGRRVLKSSANIILPEASLYIVTLCLCSNPANLHAPEHPSPHFCTWSFVLRTGKRAHRQRRQQTRATGVHAAPSTCSGVPCLQAKKELACLSEVTPRSWELGEMNHALCLHESSPSRSRSTTRQCSTLHRLLSARKLQYSNIPMSQCPNSQSAWRQPACISRWPPGGIHDLL